MRKKSMMMRMMNMEMNLLKKNVNQLLNASTDCPSKDKE